MIEKTVERINKKKKDVSFDEIKEKAELLSSDTGFPFEKALKSDDMSFICEVKKASPSKGIISEDFNPVEIAKEYEDAGASAISVLTEPYYFMGEDSYIKNIVKNVSIPVLRKDFVVDSYMIYEAKILGASAVLLICAILDEITLEKYIKIAKSLGLSPLVEAHSVEEIEMAVRSGANIIGVKTFYYHNTDDKSKDEALLDINNESISGNVDVGDAADDNDCGDACKI